MQSGALLPALQASMAVPGVFPPVEVKATRWWTAVSPTRCPYDRVQDDCDIVIAIDVSGRRSITNGESLSSMGVLLQGFTVMSRNILIEKLKRQRPTVLYPA